MYMNIYYIVCINMYMYIYSILLHVLGDAA